MKVLVTGGAGYIGSHTCKALHRAGHVPVVLDNLSTGHQSAVRWGPFVEGDLADTALIRNTLVEFEVEAVIHFAASAYVGESVEDPRKYFRNNVVNTLNLLDAMLDEGVRRVVFSSTCATYGIPETLPLTETHPQRPINPYGESKLVVERVLGAYGHAYGHQWMALRYFNAAGADPEGEIGENHDPETHLIPLIIDAALGVRPAFTIHGTDYETADGTAVRDLIHVSDLADAHVLALEVMCRLDTSLAVNLGTGVGHSVREVIAAVEAVSGRCVPVHAGERRAGDPAMLVADPALAKERLGWWPQYTALPEIVATAWAWRTRDRSEPQG